MTSDDLFHEFSLFDLNLENMPILIAVINI